MSVSIDGTGSITGLSVGGLPDGSVDADSIAAGAVTDAKIGTGAVTNVKVGTGIDSAKIGAGDVSNTEHAYLNSVSSNVQTQIAAAGASAYSGYASRDNTAASGTQAITGVGFTPKIVYFLAVMGGTNRISWGFGTSSDNRCVLDYHSANPASSYDTYSSSGDALKPMADNSNHQKGVIASMDADGFTITWTKVGTPAAATIEAHFFAIG